MKPSGSSDGSWGQQTRTPAPVSLSSSGPQQQKCNCDTSSPANSAWHVHNAVPSLPLHHCYFKPACNIRAFLLAAWPKGGLSLWLKGDLICIYNLSSIERASEKMDWKRFQRHQKILEWIQSQHFVNTFVYRDVPCAGFTVLISLDSSWPLPSPRKCYDWDDLLTGHVPHDCPGHGRERLHSRAGARAHTRHPPFSRPSGLTWGEGEGAQGSLPTSPETELFNGFWFAAASPKREKCSPQETVGQERHLPALKEALSS